MADEFHAEALRGLCCVRGMLINTNFSFMFTRREIIIGKRGAMDTFFHHEDTVNVDTSFQQCELIRSPLLLKKLSACDMYVLLFLPPIYRLSTNFGCLNFLPKKVPSI